MGTTIDAVSTVMGGGWRRHSARKLADRAGRDCIQSAGIDPADVDLLVNAGLYHDDNLGEPALAALIQEDIGLNPEDPHEGGHGTFSFDIANGACGMLTALQVADGFLRAGTIRRALIVAADAHPGRGLAADFPFGPAAGAIICGYRDDRDGLAGFRFANDPDDAAFQSSVAFDHGRNVLRFDQSSDFHRRAAALAAKAAGELLADAGVMPADVDLVVANPLFPPFLDDLASGLGVDRGLLVEAGHASDVHTAALAVALGEATRSGRIHAARNVLLISAGAGLTAGAALLLKPEGIRQ